MSNLLLVENNPDYYNVALTVLADLEYTVFHAKDYSQAKSYLDPQNNYRFELAVIDCLFPETFETDKTQLGVDLVQKMALADPTEQRMVEGLKLFEPYVDLTNPKIREYLRNIIYNCSGKVEENPILNVTQLISNFLGKDRVTSLVKNGLGMFYQKQQASPDHYTALLESMKQSVANQPLGLLVAEQVEEMGLPFVLTTSTSHHDGLTKPIQTYVSQKGWNLIDCARNQKNDKTSHQFWGRVVSQLI